MDHQVTFPGYVAIEPCCASIVSEGLNSQSTAWLAQRSVRLRPVVKYDSGIYYGSVLIYAGHTSIAVTKISYLFIESDTMSRPDLKLWCLF